MVKHNQIIRRQKADQLSAFDHFVGLALKGLPWFLPDTCHWGQFFIDFMASFVDIALLVLAYHLLLQPYPVKIKFKFGQNFMLIVTIVFKSFSYQ